jgi:hypothetical protein
MSSFAFKQLRRSWAKSLLWVLLLALVIGFFTVSFGQWYSSRENLLAAAETYTSIAAVDDTSFWRCTPEVEGVEYGSDWIRGKTRDKSKPDPYQVFLDKIEGLGMIRQIDDRQSSRAFSPNAASVAHPLEDLETAVARHQAAMAGSYEEMVFLFKHGSAISYTDFQEGISSGVLVGRCVGIEIIMPYPEGVSWDYWDETLPGFTERSSYGDLSYAAIFEIDHAQSPALHPLCRNLRYFRIHAQGILSNYQLPFTVGKDYLLAAENLYPRAYIPEDLMTTGLRTVTETPEWYLAGGLQGRHPWDYFLNTPGNKPEDLLNPEDLGNTDADYTLLTTTISFTEEIADALGIPYQGSTIRRVTRMGRGLISSARELEGSVQDFLATEEGAAWQLVIDNAQRNIHGLTVVGTSNLSAIVLFNKGDARIPEGRAFSPEEAAAGAKVCVVSAALARENGLRVGDEISLSLQKTGYRMQQRYDVDSAFPWYKPIDFTPSFAEFTEAETYRIVGTYAAPKWDYHYNYFTPNTVFIPLAALPTDIPETPDYRASTRDLDRVSVTQERAGMFSLILWHDIEEALREELGDMGRTMGLQFFDQDYSLISSQLATLNQQAGGLLLASLLVWAIVMVFFFRLVSRGLRPALGIMVSLGSGRGRVWRFALASLLILSLCGLIAGGTAGVLVYKEVMARAYATIEKSVSGFTGAPTGDGEGEDWEESAVQRNLMEISGRLPLLSVLGQGVILAIVSLVISIRESRLSPSILLESGGRK